MKKFVSMIVSIAIYFGAGLACHSQSFPEHINLHEWSLVEGELPGSTSSDWGYSRREADNLIIYLSESACKRWARPSGNARLTVNGAYVKGQRPSCNKGVNKAVMIGFFPPQLPVDCCTPTASQSSANAFEVTPPVK